MPYIKPYDRIVFNRDVDHLSPSITGPGDLNYVITRLLVKHIDRVGCSYASINEVVGVLECAKLELYRRMAALYEDKKITENGDVY
jgi:hypothetical protein